MTAVEKSGRRRVLVVDDSSLIRLYYLETLEKAGFAVEQAINGIEATEKVLEHEFDLLIVDVNMPGMDGFTFIRDLRRRDEDVAALPVLVITTESSKQDFVDARTAGANYFLVKPVSESDLVLHVAALAGTSS